MIYIISPTRSGSGWLTTALFCLGYDVCHELFTIGTRSAVPQKPFVWADTTLIFKMEEIKKELSEEDRLIFLSRDSKDILESLATLLPGYDSDEVIRAYRAAANDVILYPCPSLWLHYDSLFDPLTAEEVATFLGRDESEFVRVWKYLKDFRITNRTNELAVRKVYEEGKGKEGFRL